MWLANLILLIIIIALIMRTDDLEKRIVVLEDKETKPSIKDMNERMMKL